MQLESKAETLNDPNALADRYVAVWNEANADVRRGAIRELWTEDGAQIPQPPQEIRNAAAELGLDANLVARGHVALEARVTRAHDDFVAPGEFIFRRRANVIRLHDVVKFNWEMVRKGTGDVAGVGLEFLVLGADGRIRIDYQFIES